ncbi:MAG: alpha/beta hydrolase [Caulobacterales bacterium]
MGFGVINKLKIAAAAFAAACLGACAHAVPEATAAIPAPQINSVPAKPARVLPSARIPASDAIDAPQYVVWRDLAYGPAYAQKLDVYGANAISDKKAPIILMVHGGSWKYGDKGLGRVVDNKAGHYLARGYVFVSINYRLIPEAYPADQARDVASALAYVQAHAEEWGGDASRIVLIGHSAGAHLVSLINANPMFAAEAGAHKWMGTVALDSAAYDVERLMTGRHGKLYDVAFGTDPEFWRKTSPTVQVSGQPAPMLLVCSSKVQLQCLQAERLKTALAGYQGTAHILPVDLAHGEINVNLGLDGEYTRQVDQWLASLGLPTTVLLTEKTE